jgi:hypothetical protein
LTTAQIMIEDGANFKGSIQIEKSAEREANKNVFPRRHKRLCEIVMRTFVLRLYQVRSVSAVAHALGLQP